jgi:hypothetical protein
MRAINLLFLILALALLVFGILGAGISVYDTYASVGFTAMISTRSVEMILLGLVIGTVSSSKGRTND